MNAYPLIAWPNAQHYTNTTPYQHATHYMAESFPNGYTYSKYLAEVIIAEQVAKVPNCRVKVSIVRPAIVTNALGFDYVPRGWGMDMRGVNAAFLCYKALRGKPLTSVVPYNGTYEMHCIPVDVVANILIAAAARGHELSVSALPAKPMTALANKEHGIKCVPFTDRSDMDMSCTTLEMTPVSKHGSVQSTVGSVKGPDAHQLTSRPQPFARPRPGIPSPYRNKHSHVDCTQHSAEEAAELRARNTPDNSHTAMILSHLVTSATTPVAQRKAAPTIPERPTGYTAEKVNALLNLQPALTLKPTTSVASNTSCNTESSIDMVMDDAPRMARFPQVARVVSEFTMFVLL
ncbi:hypothetical protein SARC_06114 [Sphaeroforma arctica JP610]|uniref:Fatty acyl-CoA reductase n=1 Tax=Sphaeroforma arctica JP610 TaxID=667725 RepID=A0A0L0FXN1_9EUKA|nr:hypothetical protein SARC_06114 [Sphaeroforma arctica JP610]KNC81580.1 hypothetical protein SARC_06114 [Sphaeroforma arctica JP610]|eukprot:XP_014155482.1 hypothetical protein SARC_06114 [Sphaeroforma arctica JP610]